MERIESTKQTRVLNSNTRSSIPIHGKLPRTWAIESHGHTTFDHHKFGHRHNKYVHAIAATVVSAITCSPVMAADVGGVSATANPIANSAAQ